MSAGHCTVEVLRPTGVLLWLSQLTDSFFMTYWYDCLCWPLFSLFSLDFGAYGVSEYVCV